METRVEDYVGENRVIDGLINNMGKNKFGYLVKLDGVPCLSVFTEQQEDPLDELYDTDMILFTFSMMDESELEWYVDNLL